MELGAVSHFAQGWKPSLIESAVDLGAMALRDGINWEKIERSKGEYDFSDPRLAYIDKAAGEGVDVTLVFNWGNGLYDGGFTPYTDAGRAAFADFIVATLDHYGSIKSIEIGNEFNGNNHVDGPVLKAGYALRDDYYAALIDAVYDKVKASHPDVTVLGGATHSIPVGYFKSLFEHGTLNKLDGIAIHPYTSSAEELADHLELLRDAMGGADKRIEVTEFGQAFDDISDAPAYLLKMVSVMAANDVDAAHWYALAEQSAYPNMQLVGRSGVPTVTGDAFRFLQNQLLGAGEASDVSPDGLTYAYMFGTKALVLWGEQQKVSFHVPVQVYDASGRPITGFSGILDPDEPVVVLSEAELELGKNVVIEKSALMADSLHQFDLTNDAGAATSFEGPWSYYALSGTGKLKELTTMDGGTRAGEPWVPYIGDVNMRPLMVSAEALNPVDFSNGGNAGGRRDIVERYTAPEDMVVRIAGQWDVQDSSADGVLLRVVHNGVELLRKSIDSSSNGYQYQLDLRGIGLKAGDTLDFIVGTNATPKGGDLTDRRIQIFKEGDLADYNPAAIEAGTHQSDRSGKIVDASAAIIGRQLNGSSADDVLIAGYSDDKLKGNAGDDVLAGNGGNDLLSGGTGADHMSGGAGNDTYFVDAAGDVVDETGGDGIDVVQSTVSFSLADQARSVGSAEQLTLVGSAISGTGNSLANQLTGNRRDNLLSGESGSDTLIGGHGNDVLTGGPGSDVFVFNTSLSASSNHDHITDFQHSNDQLQLDNAIFTKLGATGALPAGYFRTGAATDADDYIVYDHSTGALYYDSNGAAAGGAILFATLTSKPSLTAADFLVI
jgi:Ca2+-binding RTX toxin-like protein